MTVYQVVYIYLDENGKEKGKSIDAIFRNRKDAEAFVAENGGIIKDFCQMAKNAGWSEEDVGENAFKYIIEPIEEDKLDAISKAYFLEGKKPVVRDGVISFESEKKTNERPK